MIDVYHVICDATAHEITEITILIIYSVIFCITSIFSLIYFRRLRSAIQRYNDIGKMLEDIVFSFKRDLNKVEEKVQKAIESQGEISIEKKRMDEMNSLTFDLKKKVEDLAKHSEEIGEECRSLKNRLEELAAKYNEILERVSKIEKEKDSWRHGKESTESKSNTISAPMLSKEEKVLTSLTETEMKVLEILAEEGEKTVSEIKDRIKLTREHTARLMKGLYTRGYVERKEDKIPYVYRLNKEMEEILKRKISS